jgi:hypothetical protein
MLFFLIILIIMTIVPAAIYLNSTKSPPTPPIPAPPTTPVPSPTQGISAPPVLDFSPRLKSRSDINNYVQTIIKKIQELIIILPTSSESTEVKLFEIFEKLLVFDTTLNNILDNYPFIVLSEIQQQSIKDNYNNYLIKYEIRRKNNNPVNVREAHTALANYVLSKAIAIESVTKP